MKKRIGILLLTTVITVSAVIVWLPNSLFVNAASIGDTSNDKFVTEDTENNVYIFESTDIRKTSNTFYRTVGFTISRCNYNEKTYYQDIENGGYINPQATDSVTISLSTLDNRGEPLEGVQHQEIINGDGTITTRWLISKEYVMTKIDEVSAQWYDEVNNGYLDNAIYIRFDAIIVLFVNGKQTGDLISGECDGLCYGNQNKVGLSTVSEMRSRMASLGFSAATRNKCINTHYDQFFLLNNDNEEKELEPDDDVVLAPESEFVETIGKTQPDYYTWNSSTKFDIAKGIPSSEKVTNHVLVDEFYGTVDIGKRTVPKQWKMTGTIRYKVKTGYNRTTRSSTYGWRSTSVSYTVSRYAYYYYIQQMALYDYTRADVKNGAYPSGIISYVGDATKVPIHTSVNGVSDPTTVNSWYPDDEQHVTWNVYSTNLGTVSSWSSKSSVKKLFDQKAESSIPKTGYATVQNDLVDINNIKYMNDEKIQAPAISAYSRIGAGDYTQNSITLPTHKEEVTIPYETNNGPYETTLDVYYTKKAEYTNLQMPVFEKKGDVAIVNGQDTDFTGGYAKTWKDNEPLYVHTPVISPVTIINPDTGKKLEAEKQKTQLIKQNVDVAYQLKLETSYTFDFSDAMHRAIQRYGWSYVLDNDWDETDNKYDKYTDKKQVHFPFTVKIDGVYYEPINDPNTPGYWINLSNFESTKFYIPSWSIENIYGVHGYDENPILFRVISINGNSHLDETQDTANTDNEYEGGKAKYVATYRIPVQVSGHIYDFQAVGVHDKDMFTGYKEGWNNEWYAFCPEKEEKKSGNKNRLGGNSVRYTLDGKLNNNWNIRNTLPFCNGSSWTYDNMGSLWKGTKFVFSLKTIANLYDEDVDSIQIEPSFRYYDKNGAEKQIDVYYSMLDDDGNHQYVKMDSTRDQNLINKVSFKGNGGEFKNAWYDEDFEYTVDKHNELTGDNLTVRGLLNREVDSYSLGHIELNSKMRLLTGNLEQCEENLAKTKDMPDFLSLAQLSSTLDPILEPSDWEKDRFRMSMQTWYGEYWVPSNLYICDKGINIEDYAEKNGLSGEEDFWKKDGYIVVNFDIKTVNNGDTNNDKGTNLQYYGGTNDQWTLQGYRPTAPVGDPELGTDKYIPVKPGDVAIIEVEHTLKDKYDNNVYLIN